LKFPAFADLLKANRSESLSNVPDNIKFVDPTLLEDRFLPESVRIFAKQTPLIRLTILGLVIYASKQLKKGMVLLDVGAGDCPYKGLFSHVTYKSTDFGKTEHEYKDIDYFCLADNIPVSKKSFDAVLCTEVLEHVADPKSVLTEFNRVLKDNGHLFITTPFIHQVHEEPYDFFRYTRYALDNLLRETGFEIVFITSRGGWIASITSILRKYLLRPSRNIKSLFPYCFLFLPIFALPIVAVRLLPLKVFAWLDRTLDKEQKYTPGYALHAVKMKDV
jgi:SAM-dependent methyltransferase